MLYLERRIKRHNLYIYILQNRKGILQFLKCTKLGCTHNKCSHKLENKKNLNLEVEENCLDGQDEYEKLHEMLYGIKHHGIILNLCLHKFHVLYALPEQLNLLKNILKLTNLPVSVIVIDKLVSNVIIKNYRSSNIFFIVLVIRFDGITINLYQALSEKINLHFFISFFHEYLKSNKAPEKLVVGYSDILLNATAFAFNNCYFDDYNFHCYNYILGKMIDLPNTLIEVDIFSIIKVFDSLDCFNNKLDVVKTFYLKCIIYLTH